MLNCRIIIQIDWERIDFKNLTEIYTKASLQQIKSATMQCKVQRFIPQKMHDYGCAWRILRVSSLTDQIFIKAQRIRTLQQKATQRVDEGQFSEFIGILNYCVMALIQIDKGIADKPDMSEDEVLSLYNAQIDFAKSLMQNKNHDYGEAWRDMREFIDRFDFTKITSRKTN